MLAGDIACGSTGSESDAGKDGTVEAAIEDAPGFGGDAAAWDHPFIQYPIVDGSGDCAPTSPPGTWAGCCNDVPCLGFCVALDDGGIGCSCYGIPGGCDMDAKWPLGCCVRSRACRPAVQCTWSK